MRLLPDPETIVDSAVTGWDHLLGGGVADTTPTPSSIIHEGPQCTVHRYRSRRRARADRAPVLLVPPLAAPASCFDLHRDCSLAQHLTAMGYPTYLVDYGPIGFHDRALGLEHWVEDVIPTAIRVASEDAGGAPVQPRGLVPGRHHDPAGGRGRPQPAGGLGGDGGQPVRLRADAAAGADPPARQAHRRGAGRRAVPRARRRPAPLVSRAFQLTSFERYLTKPLFLATHLHDRDTIAHMEAVDAYMAHMSAYPAARSASSTTRSSA